MIVKVDAQPFAVDFKNATIGYGGYSCTPIVDLVQTGLTEDITLFQITKFWLNKQFPIQFDATSDSQSPFLNNVKRPPFLSLAYNCFIDSEMLSLPDHTLGKSRIAEDVLEYLNHKFSH